jgi:hypothetical protein
MSVKFYELTNFSNKNNSEITVLNPVNQAIAHTDDLDNNYISNNGCLVKFFTFKLNINSKYLDFISINKNNYIEFIFKLFNLPQPINNYKIVNNNNEINVLTTSSLDQSIFNNIPIVDETIETEGTLNENKIQKYYESIIKKDTQGNYVSIIVSFLNDQIEEIIEKNLVQSFFQNRIPIIVPYGHISPSILYNKLLQDTTREIESYILNIGPCNLDSISAMFNFYKIDQLSEHNSTSSNFNEVSSNYFSENYNNKYFSYFSNYIENNNSSWTNGLPSLITEIDNSNYISNFNNYVFDYNIDLSEKYIIYIGIGNDYGWNNATKFLEHIAYKYVGFDIDKYNDISSGTAGNVAIRHSSLNYTDDDIYEYYKNRHLLEYIEDAGLDNNRFITKDRNYYSNNNILKEEIDYFTLRNYKNPNIVAIKVPYYQTYDEQRKNIIGIGVYDAWIVAKGLIEDSSNNMTYNNTKIFIQSYGVESDKESIKFLINNSQFINMTYGSIYDFLEINFKNLAAEYSTYTYDSDFMNGLKSVKSYNAINIRLINNFNNLVGRLQNYIKYENIFQDLNNNFDQFKFFEMLTIVNNIGLLILNTIKANGSNSNFESLKTTLKIPSGREIFDSNKIFNYKELAKSQSANENGSSEFKILFNDLINTAYNYGNYWSLNDGEPFNRNSAFCLYERDNKAPIQEFLDVNIKYHYLPVYYILRSGNYYPLFINSDTDLINSLIFRCENDLDNYNTLYEKHLNNYLNNSTIILTDGSGYSFVSDKQSNNNLLKISDLLTNFGIQPNASGRFLIKEILLGNDFNNFDNDFQHYNTLESVIFGTKIDFIRDGTFYDCENLNKINFILESSCHTIGIEAFDSCISLETVLLPDSIINIDKGAFWNCIKLNSINFTNTLQTLGDYAFGQTNLTNVNIISLNSMGIQCFEDCHKLTNVIINNNCNITILKDQVFKNCISLNSVEIPNKINTFGSELFFNCKSLENINIPSDLSSIGNNCFANCENLLNINFYNTNITKASDNLFLNCEKLKFCIFPTTLKEFGNNVFKNCQDLSYIIINSSLDFEISSNIFQDISHDVIIYYYGSLTPASYFDNISNKILIDVENTYLEYKLFNYYENLIIEKYSAFQLNNLDIKFYIEDFEVVYNNLDISYTIDLQNNTELSTDLSPSRIEIPNALSSDDILFRNFNNYINKIDVSGIYNFEITFGNNLSYNINTILNVVDSNPNKPTIIYDGNLINYLTIDNINNIIKYNCNAKDKLGNDISINFINNVPNKNNINSSDFYDGTLNVYKKIPLFVNYFYTIDNSNNYNIIYYFNEIFDTGTIRKNLRIESSDCSINWFVENNITKVKLSLRFENDGNSDVNRELKSFNTNIDILDTKSFLFPIFATTDNSFESQNLIHINGPPQDTSYILLNLTSDVFYFKNRINKKIMKGTNLIINKSYNTYEKIFKSIDGNSLFPNEQSWGLKEGLYANDYIELDIIFNYFGNCKDILNNENNIFTKNNDFAIFLDNGTSSDNSNNFYNAGYFKEFLEYDAGLYVNDLYRQYNNLTTEITNYNDNVFNFKLPNNSNQAVLNGPYNLIIEDGSFFEDFGVMYLGEYDQSFNYSESPANTYNSNNINLSNGIYEISYIIYPNGEESSKIDISRTITILENNPNKPTIVLGNPDYQYLLTNQYPLRNLQNYAFDICYNDLPIFSKLIDYDLSQSGFYYQYFYTYDNFGNYVSKTQTIEVSDNSFTNLEFNKEFTNYNIENNKLELYIQNNGNIDFVGDIRLIFKVLQSEPELEVYTPPEDWQMGKINYNNKNYYWANTNNSNFNYDIANVNVNFNILDTTYNIISDFSDPEEALKGFLIVNTIVKSNTFIKITIDNFDRVNHPIGVFIGDIYGNEIPNDELDIDNDKLFIYENLTNLKLLYGNNYSTYIPDENKLNIYIQNTGLINKIAYFLSTEKYPIANEIDLVFSSIFSVTFNENEGASLNENFMETFGQGGSRHLEYVDISYYYPLKYYDQNLYIKNPIDLQNTFLSVIENTSDYNVELFYRTFMSFNSIAFEPPIQSGKTLYYSINNLVNNLGESLIQINETYALLLDLGINKRYGHLYETNDLFDVCYNKFLYQDNIFGINLFINLTFIDSSYNSSENKLTLNIYNNNPNSIFYGSGELEFKKVRLNPGVNEYDLSFTYLNTVYYYDDLSSSNYDLNGIQIITDINHQIINNEIEYETTINSLDKKIIEITNFATNGEYILINLDSDIINTGGIYQLNNNYENIDNKFVFNV